MTSSLHTDHELIYQGVVEYLEEAEYCGFPLGTYDTMIEDMGGYVDSTRALETFSTKDVMDAYRGALRGRRWVQSAEGDHWVYAEESPLS